MRICTSFGPIYRLSKFQGANWLSGLWAAYPFVCVIFLNFHNTKVRNQAFKIVSESLMIVSKKVNLNLLLNKEILKIAFNKNASNRLILRRCYFLLWMKVELQEFALTYFKLPTNYNLGASNRKLITVSMFSTNSTCFI